MKAVALSSMSGAPMAPEHWTIEKKQRAWDIELRDFREKQRQRLTAIRLKSKRKVAELHERIYFTVRWANPKLPNAYQKIVFDYCDHLIGPMPDAPYPKWSLLVVWQTRLESGPEAKASAEVMGLMERLSKLVMRRDEVLVKTLVELEENTHRLTIAREGNVRWHTETRIHCARDDYWTIWYLSRNGQTEELRRYIVSNPDVNIPDPDFGYTALHYACRYNHFEAMKVLLEAGAHEQVVTPEDGRTPLHLAAAYGSREMVLELLAVGAIYEATDHLGATALDMARQNHNHAVVKTLEQWVHLVPPQDDSSQVQVEEEEVPEEYLTTSFEELMKMSAALRVVTSRLEGPINSSQRASSIDSGMEVGAELRLCEKRAAMCEAEGFHEQSVKTLRRRWTAAKRAFLRQRHDKQQRLDEEEERERNRIKNEEIAAAVCLENDVIPPSTTEASQCAPQHQDVSIAPGNSPKTALDSHVPATPTPVGEILVPSTKTTTTLLADTSTNTPVTVITPAFLYSICLQLAEVFLTDAKYEAAEVVLSDGLTLLVNSGLDTHSRMCLLKRYSQLLLFLADMHGASGPVQSEDAVSTFSVKGQSHGHRRQLLRSTSMPASFSSMYGESDSGIDPLVENGNASRGGGNQMMDLDVSMSEEEAIHFIASISQRDHQRIDSADDLDNDDDSRLARDPCWESSMLDASTWAGEGETRELRTTSHVTFSSPNVALFSREDNPTESLEFGAGGVLEMMDLIRTLVPSAVLVSATAQRLQQRSVAASRYSSLPTHKQYLVRVDNCLQEAIGLMRNICAKDFIETPLLGQLLHLAAESFDRYRMHV